MIPKPSGLRSFARSREALLNEPETPYFLIRESDLRRNLARIHEVRCGSGVKVLLALKCFSTWGAFPLLRGDLDGTAASSPYEARLGREFFGGESHVYSPGFSPEDLKEMAPHVDAVVFNSLSQLDSLRGLVPPLVSVGLRFNPDASYSSFPLANPSRPDSHLGVRLPEFEARGECEIDGALFHMNCDNDDFPAAARLIDHVSDRFAPVLDRVQWVSLGGGIAFTSDSYPIPDLVRTLEQFAGRHGVQLYLEPGEAVVSNTTDLVVTVLDIVQTAQGQPAAIVDSATETHRLDTLIYSEPARVEGAVDDGRYPYTIASRSCLAGDHFGIARFDDPLQVGDRLHLLDSGGYSMVKMNWFNGLRMPSIYCQRSDGGIELVAEFGYEDFRRAASGTFVSRP